MDTNGADGAADQAGGGGSAIVPSIAALQIDIGFGNQFRLELIKTTFAIAAALLGFTAAFRPRLFAPSAEWLMWFGWFWLAVSIVGGMGNMYGWERFYISYRDHKADQAAGDAARKVITRWRHVAMALQFGGFALGVIGVGLFAGFNLDAAQPGS